jgi:hypothetical protein
MNLKNIVPACAVVWLAIACEKPNESSSLENSNLLSGVEVYVENAAGDTARYRLKYDSEQRLTGYDLFLDASNVPYFTNNTIRYEGQWQVQRMAVNVNVGSPYEETDSSRVNAQFNPQERAKAFLAIDAGSAMNRTTGRQSIQYTYDNAGQYRAVRIRGWTDRRTESPQGKEHIFNTDSSEAQIVFVNNLLQSTTVDATAFSRDSSALGQTSTQTWTTLTKTFLYPGQTKAPPAHRNAYAHQPLYPLDPYFFNGSVQVQYLPDRVETTIQNKNRQGQVLQTETRTEEFRYEFYPSGFIKTIRASSGGNTVVYRYTYDTD